ncbi:hypothetical protein [Metallibacterium scheffleri]|uniref:Uncharacterized protein n=1 Tax=Metallibacterium scheffleri TaxID=993689 RepID=A0A4S3KS57_9GAMM|nr:hypothetical protein [Metallibacterium scheffleri]THD11308.1 hypothetical protein B1806_04095 [Metallibacterium scheffleri]
MTSDESGVSNSVDSVPAEQGTGAAQNRIPHGLSSMVIGLAVWSIVVSSAASYVTWRVLENQRTADLAMRPPVVVLNSFGWIKHAGSGHTIEQRYVSGAERLKGVIAELRKHGALVLDESAVRAAPPQVLLKTPRR